MKTTRVASIHARQILDSRGRPTVEADVRLAGGAEGRGVSPSGASTGASEAHELRDRDSAWYGGRGVRKAVANVEGEIAAALQGRDALDQAGLDTLLREIDGTPRLERLGANAILAVSLAICRAAAIAVGHPLHQRIAELAGGTPSLPMPMTNILSGGLHAGRSMDVQDFLVMPVGAPDYHTGLHWICRVRQMAADLMAGQGLSTLLADEGGLSPGYAESRQALDLLSHAIEAAGLRLGEDVAIALDVASSALFRDGAYVFERAGRRYRAEELIVMIESWVRDYCILSVEDGLAEEDWENWAILTERLGRIQLVGDDLFTTNPDRIRRGIGRGVANSVLVKLNQNGTLSGTLEAIALARQAGYSTVISARSGETEDDFIAHLAVGTGGAQIKIGSVRSSERLAKYNTLLRLESQHTGLAYAGARGLSGRP